MSLHSAYSASGANELTGGSPAYARQAIAWDAAASAAMALSGTETFDIPPASTVAFAGFWSASTSGTFYGMAPAGSGAVLAFTAAATGDALTIPGHSITSGATVVVWAGAGATLPTGLTAGTVYYARDVSGSTLKLAATSGGSAIDLSADGAGLIQTITPETYAGQGTYSVEDPGVGSMLNLV
jgi:hypothetical protein